MDFHLLRRAWHRAMAKGNYYTAWAILGELGEQNTFESWLDMRDTYHRELSWDG